MEQVYGRYYAGQSAKEPDCKTCIHRPNCQSGRDGWFCAAWRSEPPKDRGEGPAEKWSRGEDM